MRNNIVFTKIEILGATLIGALLLLASYLSGKYIHEIQGFIGSHGEWGVLAYISSATFATIIAPVSATPLIPIASSLWGPTLAALYSILGWSLGAVIAFILARKYGYKRIQRFIKLKRIQEYANKFPKQNLFLSVVLMRLLLPVDILSYALGLFTDMKLRSYILATLIGITPFAFAFSYMTHLPFILQVVLLCLMGIVLFFGYKEMKNRTLSV